MTSIYDTNEGSSKRMARSVEEIIADMDENDERMKALGRERDMLMREYDIATEDRIPRVI